MVDGRTGFDQYWHGSFIRKKNEISVVNRHLLEPLLSNIMKNKYNTYLKKKFFIVLKGITISGTQLFNIQVQKCFI